MKITVQDQRVTIVELSDEELVALEKALDITTDGTHEGEDPITWALWRAVSDKREALGIDIDAHR